ncbi:uracil-DNA glycosylase [Ruminococcaceae bacterium OttesenSCG-928-L11]|nr:uracil-DNA glycosylase [Ruminococcaceae bacterium OttesenSCG-928-L11]
MTTNWKPDWEPLLRPETEKAYFRDLAAFVEREYAEQAVYPPKEQIFTALALTGYRETRAVILGQDPYHGPGQAHGLSFSVASEEAKFPPSLRNLFKELEADMGISRSTRCLTDWAEQGVLLLNTVLTVRAGQAGSHRGKGWEQLTDAVIRALNDRREPVIFVLWGNDAKKKLPLLTGPHHHILQSAHPSPLSAYNGFFGSRPYSRINGHLREMGQPEIVWG